MTIRVGDSPNGKSAATPPRRRPAKPTSGSKLPVQASRDPLVTIGPEGKIAEVNEATIQMTGVDREDLVGTDFSDYFTEPDRAREGYLQVFSQGFVTDYPLTIRHTDGELTEVLYNASVYRDAGGQLGVFAAVRDVTDSMANCESFPKPIRSWTTSCRAPRSTRSSGRTSTTASFVERGSAPQLRLYRGRGHRQGLEHPHVPQTWSLVPSTACWPPRMDGLAEGTFERVRKDGSRFTASVGRDPARRQPGAPDRLPADERRHLREGWPRSSSVRRRSTPAA
jgi:PAS domain S-box-containing protein